MNITTATLNMAASNSTNATDASFPSKIPTTTAPSGDGVLEMPPDRANAVVVVPYGTDAANENFVMRVLGWSNTGSLWTPIVLMEATCTLGAAVGVSGATPANTDFFCDTIASVSGSSLRTIVSWADDSIAHFVLDLVGSQKVELIYNRNGSAATCNALVRFI